MPLDLTAPASVSTREGRPTINEVVGRTADGVPIFVADVNKAEGGVLLAVDFKTTGDVAYYRMGWTFGDPLPAGETPKSRLDADFSGEAMDFDHGNPETVVRRVLDSAIVGKTYYAAVEVTKTDGSRFAYAAIVLYSNTAKHGFGAKAMAERMGPAEAECPKHILDLLSPASEIYSGEDREWAEAWRHRCLLAAEANRKAKALRDGDLVTLPRPIRFGDGVTSDRFRVVKVGSKRRFYSKTDGAYCAISDAQLRRFMADDGPRVLAAA